MPVVTAVGLAKGGWWIALGPLYLLGLLPLLDLLVGHDHDNPVPARVGPARAAHDFVLWSWVPVQLAFIAFALRVADGTSWGTLLAMGFATGLVTGAGGITVAHELMHRPTKQARAAAEFLMTTVSYGHFCTEHVRGHHRRVATPLDPATSRRDESLYQFWARSIVGGWNSARELDRAWARANPGKPAPWVRRRRLWVLFAVASLVVAGGDGLVFFLVQSLFAVLLLETINYIEHYGLRRMRRDDGAYERVRPHHSWNASQRVTNRFLFNLQRHSDHHASAHRPHWALRHFVDVPQLPFSYPTAFVVALVPPLWRHIMNPLVDEWESPRE